MKTKEQDILHVEYTDWFHDEWVNGNPGLLVKQIETKLPAKANSGENAEDSNSREFQTGRLVSYFQAVVEREYILNWTNADYVIEPTTEVTHSIDEDGRLQRSRKWIFNMATDSWIESSKATFERELESFMSGGGE